MPEARPGQLDASLLLAWTRGVAARWLPPHAVYRRNDLAPQAVRQVALATIRGTAEAMAAAPGRTGGECSTNAERIAEWLTACANDVAQTDEETNPEQRMAEFATEPRKSAPAAERLLERLAAREHPGDGNQVGAREGHRTRLLQRLSDRRRLDSDRARVAGRPPAVPDTDHQRRGRGNGPPGQRGGKEPCSGRRGSQTTDGGSRELLRRSR